MKRETSYNTIAQALQAVRKVGESLAIVYDSKFIATDNAIDRETIAREIAEMKQAKVLQYATEKHPYLFYMAVRERGQEGSSNKAHVLERCARLGSPVFTMVFKYVHGEPVKVTYNDLRK